MNAPVGRALEGIRVLDVTQVMAGPSARCNYATWART